MNEDRNPIAPTGARTCAKCGAPFVCGMEAGAERCWCADLPARLPVPDAAAGCYCPACLRALIDAPS